MHGALCRIPYFLIQFPRKLFFEFEIPKVTVHKCAETIKGRKLYEEIRQIKIFVQSIWFRGPWCLTVFVCMPMTLTGNAWCLHSKKVHKKFWSLQPQLKVSKFQNVFMKSSFFPKYEPNIVRISPLYCATHTLQGRNLHNFWFIFWEKR